MAQFGFQPKPRENLGPQHMLPARFEQILSVSRSLKKDYRTVGTVASQATLVAEGDPERSPITVPLLGMIYRQTGIPLNNPDLPNIAKLDSRVPAGFYYYHYTKPVFWMKDESYRHIPGFTRYVINKDGVVANAQSAQEVSSDNPYMIELAADGANNLRKFPKAKLMALAFTQLPVDFVDYGRGNHSHDYEFSSDQGGYTWIPKPELTTKNNQTGQVDKYRNIFDFQENAGLAFEERIQIKAPMAFTGILGGQTLQVGLFSIRETNPPAVEEKAPVATPTPQEQQPSQAEQFAQDDVNLVEANAIPPTPSQGSSAAIEDVVW
jgi:hypothetical protein